MLPYSPTMPERIPYPTLNPAPNPDPDPTLKSTPITNPGQDISEAMARLRPHPPGDGTTIVSVIDTKVFDIRLTATWRGEYIHDPGTPAGSLGVASFSPARSEHQEHFLQFIHEVVDTLTEGHVLLGEDGRAAIFESKPRDPPPWKLHLRLLSADQPYFRAL